MKINIENYESMTAEEKIAALEESYVNGEKLKSSLDKATSEAAAYKKQLREKQSDEEARLAAEAEAKAEAEQRASDLQKRVEELERERLVNGYVNAYLALGYDEKTAKSTAEALAKGDMEVVFKNQRIHAENREKTLREELLNETPDPAAGEGDTVMDKTAFSKLSLDDKQKMAAENPELYQSFFEK